MRVWDVGTGRLLREFTEHGKDVWSVAFSPAGRYIATGSRDGSARLWGLPE